MILRGRMISWLSGHTVLPFVRPDSLSNLGWRTAAWIVGPSGFAIPSSTNGMLGNLRRASLITKITASETISMQWAAPAVTAEQRVGEMEKCTYRDHLNPGK